MRVIDSRKVGVVDGDDHVSAPQSTVQKRGGTGKDRLDEDGLYKQDSKLAGCEGLWMKRNHFKPDGGQIELQHKDVL